MAFLGWGSLVWDPRELKMSGSWEKDGPCLPIEFARISKDRRITLVLCPEAAEVRTLWVRADCENLQDAIRNLACREGTTTEHIGFVSTADGNRSCNAVQGIITKIESWAKQKQFDAVVWTDLPSNFKEKRRLKLNGANVVTYLKELEGQASRDAEAYVRNAPRQIRTEIRAVIEKELGWKCTNDCGRFNWTKLRKDLETEMRIVRKSPDGSFWVVVPREPATFGHLLVVSWKGNEGQDIADKGLFTDSKHMQSMMAVIHEIASNMSKSLTSNGAADGRKCEKVYIATLCETKDFPFHFHLIPRYEGQNTGFLFLFERELQEARWMLDNNEEDKTLDGFYRVGQSEGMLNYHRHLLSSHEWTKSNDERKNFIASIRKAIAQVMIKNQQGRKS